MPILRKVIKRNANALAEKKINLSCADEVLRLIARRSFSHKYGARNMRRFIQKEIEDRLAGKIISDYRHFYSFVKLEADGDEIIINCM